MMSDKLREIASKLGVAAPESNEDLFNDDFISSLNRSLDRVFKKHEAELNSLTDKVNE